MKSALIVIGVIWLFLILLIIVMGWLLHQVNEAMERSEGSKLPPPCFHGMRSPFHPQTSFGDESDYQSVCCYCGTVLRDPPNYHGA